MSDNFSNFICCDLQHSDFHAFLDHHEKTHVGPSAPIPAVSATSPSTSNTPNSIHPQHTLPQPRSHSSPISPVYTPFTPNHPLLGYSWDTAFTFPFPSVFENAHNNSSTRSATSSRASSSTPSSFSTSETDSSLPSSPTNNPPLLPMIYKEPYDLFHPLHYEPRYDARGAAWGDHDVMAEFGMGIGNDFGFGSAVCEETGEWGIKKWPSLEGDVDMRSSSSDDEHEADFDTVHSNSTITNHKSHLKSTTQSKSRTNAKPSSSSMSPPPELCFSSSCCSSDAEIEVDGEGDVDALQDDRAMQGSREGNPSEGRVNKRAAAFEMSGMGRAKRAKGKKGLGSQSLTGLKKAERKSIRGITTLSGKVTSSRESTRSVCATAAEVLAGSSLSTSASSSSKEAIDEGRTRDLSQDQPREYNHNESRQHHQNETRKHENPQPQTGYRPLISPTSTRASSVSNGVENTRSGSYSSHGSVGLLDGLLGCVGGGSGGVKPPIKSRSVALGGRKREKTFKCPTPRCIKSYLNPNGLKYHLEKGTCRLEGPEEEEEEEGNERGGVGSTSTTATTTTTTSESFNLDTQPRTMISQSSLVVPSTAPHDSTSTCTPTLTSTDDSNHDKSDVIMTVS